MPPLLFLFGYDTIKEGASVREHICFLTNEIKLDPHFSPKYMFQFFGEMRGISHEVIEQRRKELFQYFGIEEFEDKKIEELSTGMKQKAAIAVSLVHDPDVIIFDEPTSGLDIVTARNVTDYLKKLRDEGKLVIISTHIMSEAEKLCDKVGIIIGGKKVIEGTIDEILHETNTTELEDAFFHLNRTLFTERGGTNVDENVDLIVSRAVGKMIDVWELSKSHLKKDGKFLIYKAKLLDEDKVDVVIASSVGGVIPPSDQYPWSRRPLWKYGLLLSKNLG